MKPQSVVFIDEIPRTPSMKIDRQRLPVPQHSRINVSAEFLPPQNPIEEVLTAIWSEILQIDGIGIHDNFLELGGDSLTSTRIISKIRGIMDVKLNMHEAFSAVTIAEMAKLIERILDPMDEDDPFE